jgi:outer membrane protein assembly factor BamB
LLDPAADAPLAVSAPLGTPAPDVSALVSWQDVAGARWVAARGGGGVRAFKLIEAGGKASFSPGWAAPAIPSALPPLVINGVLFTASTGTRGAPSVLYAIDAATGKPLWNSGTTITTTIRGGLAAGQGNVYVPGSDGTLYAFGFDIEK